MLPFTKEFTMTKIRASKENARKAEDHLEYIKNILISYGAPTQPVAEAGEEPKVLADRLLFLENFLGQCVKKLPKEESFDKDESKKKDKKSKHK
jgi:hypothetical protein